MSRQLDPAGQIVGGATLICDRYPSKHSINTNIFYHKNLKDDKLSVLISVHQFSRNFLLCTILFNITLFPISND